MSIVPKVGFPEALAQSQNTILNTSNVNRLYLTANYCMSSDEMDTELKDWDSDCLLEIKRAVKEDSSLLNDGRAAALHLDTNPEERTFGNSLKDKLDAELKDLGGNCIEVMRLLKDDSSLLKDRALAVLHLGVSRGCVEIVEQVVKFCNGEDILGDESGKDKQGVQSSREEEINASSGNKHVATVAPDEVQTKADNKSEASGAHPSHSQDDAIRVAVDKATRRHLLELTNSLAFLDSRAEEIRPRPVVDFDELLRAKYMYSGPAREFDALGVAVVNGNLDVLALLLTKTPSASRIGPKTQSASLIELHRDQLRKITEGVVERIKGDSVSLRMCQSIFDAWRNDREFNFLFWDFKLWKERVSEYLFHFLCTKRCQGSSTAKLIRNCLWRQVWDYQGSPWEEPLWQSLLKLHDAQGRTPLHVMGDEGTEEALLDLLHNNEFYEVDEFVINARDGLGRTPFHRSVVLGNPGRPYIRYSNSGCTVIRRFRHQPKEPMEIPFTFLAQQGIYVDRLVYTSVDDKNGFPGNRDYYATNALRNATMDRRDTLRCGVVDDGVLHDLYSSVSGKNGFPGRRDFDATTALHSAIMRRSAGMVYKIGVFSPEDPLFSCSIANMERTMVSLDSFELATLTGDVVAAKLLLDSAEQGHWKTTGQLGRKSGCGWIAQEHRTPSFFDGTYLLWPTIHIAASSGNYELLKVFIESKICDPYIVDHYGRTVLHAVLDPQDLRISGHLFDFVNVKYIGSNYLGPPPYESTIVERQGCINLLLQSGCDIFKVDENGQAPYPRGSLSTDNDFLSWWYERQLKEFNTSQNAMSFATNAISVMATLVATASYVGPLQPPLGYSSGDGPNQIQAKYIWVRIFIVCDTLSFYLAIAAITFSLIPALPMPQQPMAAELEKTRGMIILAVATLFPSIVCILLAFAAGSIVVISANGISSLGGNLTVITASIGGGICLTGFFLLFVRLLGIIFPRTGWVRKIYDLTSSFLQLRGTTFATPTWARIK